VDALRREPDYQRCYERLTAFLLAGANILPDTDMEYFGAAGDRMHMMSTFRSIRISLMRWPPRIPGR
jgi:hypothetical protein